MRAFYFYILSLCMTLSALNAPNVECANILGLFSHPGKSHFDFFHPLFLGLAEAGHNITMISYFPNKEPVPNYTDFELTGMPIIASNVDLKNFEASNTLIPFKVPTFFMLHSWGMKACEITFNHQIIKTLLSEPHPKYDIIILEQFNNDCMMAIAHLLQAPVISLSSCALMPWHFQRMGSPFIPSVMPSNFLPHTEEMNFVERLNNFIHHHTLNLLYSFYTQRETNALIKKHFGSTVPLVQELVKNTSLMLINQHFSLTGALPYAPNIIEVGGLQIKEEKPLPPALQTILDNASKGVIFISWGSMIRPETLPDDKRDSLLQAITQFPEYQFLMKWPNESLPNKPKNVITLDWMPQRDILCHPNVKAFVYHGGLLGSSEAAFCGVPMMVTPIYGDQFLNSAFIKQRKLGVLVEYKDFNAANIVEALKIILTPEFAKHAKLLSEAFNSRPEKPLERAIWWVEHAIQTRGAPFAQSASKHIEWFIINSFDIYIFLVLCIAVVILVLRKIVKTCICVFVKKTPNKIKKH